jgi:GTP-binding protein
VESVEFVDECTVHVRGGDGGNGVASTRREKHVPRGGPDGGDGGAGGDVILEADATVTSLLDLHRYPHQRGQDGRHGEGGNRTGADGDDTIVSVPLGTVVRHRDDGIVLADLVRPGQRYVAARGGRGGRGNAAFANRYRRVPRFAEYGEKVDERPLRLELKVIADVGLVGFPSAGKSSLISRLSAAKPRVEAWPFTTLTPHLGVMRAGDTDQGAPIDVVLADVPGLIEGASAGKGLGHRFLRHVERCHVLLHVLDSFPFDPDRDPVSDLDVIRGELGRHDPELLTRTELVALNKIDLPDGQAMADVVRPELEARGYEVFEISAVSGAGLDALRFRIGDLVGDLRRARGGVITEDVRPDEIVIRLESTGPDFTVGRHDNGGYQVRGRRVERWVQMLPLGNNEAVRHLQGRLRRAGVEKALVDAGAREGDPVVIGDVEFEFEPNIDDLPAEEREAILAAEMEEELGLAHGDAYHDADEDVAADPDDDGAER